MCVIGRVMLSELPEHCRAKYEFWKESTNAAVAYFYPTFVGLEIVQALEARAPDGEFLEGREVCMQLGADTETFRPADRIAIVIDDR